MIYYDEVGYSETILDEVFRVHEKIIAHIEDPTQTQISAFINAYAVIRAAEIQADATRAQAEREAAATIHAARVNTGQLESKYQRR